MDMQLMLQGLQVAAFGLGGVFTVLILFYLSTKGLLQYSIYRSKKIAQKALAEEEKSL